MKIKDSVILITGGASGIGEDMAITYSKQGAIVYICDLNIEKGKKIMKESNGKIMFIECDTTDENNVIDMFKIIVKNHKRVDVVINSAGIGIAELTATELSTHSWETFDKVWRINTYGIFLVSKHAANIMIKNYDPKADCNGVIIFISSVAAFDGQKGQIGYGMSKGAVVGMQLPMARDLGKYRIRVNTICPGVTATPLISSFKDNKIGVAIKEATPLKDFAKPEHITLTGQFMIECDFINGTEIRVDGGCRVPFF
jgi:NAD(P)-dependent dehydrogenase (short-subunit alcohol dehydrogenase family)